MTIKKKPGDGWVAFYNFSEFFDSHVFSPFVTNLKTNRLPKIEKSRPERVFEIFGKMTFFTSVDVESRTRDGSFWCY